MKYFMVLFTMLFGFMTFADVYVNGYAKRNGTYVQPHYRSSPDNTSTNNYSTYGNTNPYTGRAGTVTPCKKDPYSYACTQYQNR